MASGKNDDERKGLQMKDLFLYGSAAQEAKKIGATLLPRKVFNAFICQDYRTTTMYLDPSQNLAGSVTVRVTVSASVVVS